MCTLLRVGKKGVGKKDPDFGAIFGPPSDAAADKKDPDFRAIFGPPYGGEAVCLLVFVLVQVLAASVWIHPKVGCVCSAQVWPGLSCHPSPSLLGNFVVPVYRAAAGKPWQLASDWKWQSELYRSADGQQKDEQKWLKTGGWNGGFYPKCKTEGEQTT